MLVNNITILKRSISSTVFILLLAISGVANAALNPAPTSPDVSAQNPVNSARHDSRVDLSRKFPLNKIKTDDNNKLGHFVRSLAAQKKSSVGTMRSSALTRVKDNQMMLAYITLSEIGDAEIAKLSSMGVQIEIVNMSLRKVQAWINIDDLQRLVALPNILSIKTPRFARPRSGQINTEGDAILRANQLRSMGFRGQGIRVGVVSDGSNNWTSARASGDLPATLTRYGSCTTRTADPANCIPQSTCNEGTAMAEIIYDLAPDAQLAVAAVSTSLEFIQRINQLANTFKADIIVDDLGFFGEPYFEDGDIAKAVAALPKRVLYISSAGNSGNTHYEDEYKQLSSFGRNFHDFSNNDNAMGFIVRARGFVLAIMQWNDRFDAPTSDYDLFIDSATANVGASVADQTNGADPIEAVCTYNPSFEDVVNFASVERFSGAAKRLEMFFLGSSLIEYSKPAGSIFGHAGVRRTLAIGTINASEPGNNNIAFYSSRGPSRIDFPTIKNRAKPDLTGIDGVAVTGAGGFSSPFFGTSAAAPHVAGVAALLMSVSPRVTALNVKNALTQGSVDLGSSGRDSIYGYGRVDAVGAKNKLQEGVVLPPFIILLDD